MDLTGAVELKLDALIDGVNITNQAMSELKKANSRLVHGLYNYHAMSDTSIPQEFSFPCGVVVQVRFTPSSELVIDFINGSFVIIKRGKQLSKINFSKRPAFYDKYTSSGTPMSEVVQVVGADCVKIYSSNFCFFENIGKTCEFCTIDSSGIKVYRKNINDIVESFGECMQERFYGHVMMAAGTYSEEDRGAIEMSRIVVAIREKFKLDSLKGSVSIVPPLDLTYLDVLKSSGIEYLTLNMEVFDKKIFSDMCPGKASEVGREHFFEAFDYAVKLFGRGKVRSNFVAGLEPLSSLKKGFQTLAKIGVVPTATILRVTKKSRLFGKIPLQDRCFYKEVYSTLANIYAEYDISPPWCEKCRATTLENEGHLLK